jgi:hypothetical protein
LVAVIIAIIIIIIIVVVVVVVAGAASVPLRVALAAFIRILPITARFFNATEMIADDASNARNTPFPGLCFATQEFGTILIVIIAEAPIASHPFWAIVFRGEIFSKHSRFACILPKIPKRGGHGRLWHLEMIE